MKRYKKYKARDRSIAELHSGPIQITLDIICLEFYNLTSTGVSEEQNKFVTPGLGVIFKSHSLSAIGAHPVIKRFIHRLRTMSSIAIKIIPLSFWP